MKFETILLDKSDHIARITLNRPEIFNAVTPQMFIDLKAALKDVNEDPDIRVMILTGAGKAFCASADIHAEKGEVGKRLMHHMGIDELHRFLKHNPQQVTLGIRDLQKPTIAMVNGLAIGDGFDWVLACDIRIGSEKAKFMNAYIQMGLFPVTGLTWMLPRFLPLGRVFELLYTGEWLKAEEAHKFGVLNELVSSEKLEEETMSLARKIAQGPSLALRMMKMQTYRGLEIGINPALELAADGEVLMMTTDDHIEAVASWLEKRQAKFTGK